MVEATNTLQQAKLRAKMHMATYVLARQAAIKATTGCRRRDCASATSPTAG